MCRGQAVKLYFPEPLNAWNHHGMDRAELLINGTKSLRIRRRARSDGLKLQAATFLKRCRLTCADHLEKFISAAQEHFSKEKLFSLTLYGFPSSCERSVARTTASITVPLKDFCSSAYSPAIVVPPGEVTSSFSSPKCFALSSAMRAAP